MSCDTRCMDLVFAVIYWYFINNNYQTISSRHSRSLVSRTLKGKRKFFQKVGSTKEEYQRNKRERGTRLINFIKLNCDAKHKHHLFQKHVQFTHSHSHQNVLVSLEIWRSAKVENGQTGRLDDRQVLSICLRLLSSLLAISVYFLANQFPVWGVYFKKEESSRFESNRVVCCPDFPPSLFATCLGIFLKCLASWLLADGSTSRTSGRLDSHQRYRELTSDWSIRQLS